MVISFLSPEHSVSLRVDGWTFIPTKTGWRAGLGRLQELAVELVYRAETLHEIYPSLQTVVRTIKSRKQWLIWPGTRVIILIRVMRQTATRKFCVQMFAFRIPSYPIWHISPWRKTRFVQGNIATKAYIRSSCITFVWNSRLSKVRSVEWGGWIIAYTACCCKFSIRAGFLIPCTIGERTRVRRPQIVYEEITGTIFDVYVEGLSTTAIDVKKVHTGLDSHFCIILRMRSLQPNWRYSATMVWICHCSRHFSTYMAVETVPSPRKSSIAQCYLSWFPNTLITSSWLVNFNVISLVTASIALSLMGLPESRKGKSKPKY